MDAISYLLKLQTDQVILDGHDQACPGMPKEVFETYISEKLLEFQTWFLGSHLKVLEKIHVTITIETLTLVLDIKREHTLLSKGISLYRPPGTIHSFVTDLIQLVENVLSFVNVTRILVLGDFNLDQNFLVFNSCAKWYSSSCFWFKKITESVLGHSPYSDNFTLCIDF